MILTASHTKGLELSLPATFEEIEQVCPKIQTFLEQHQLNDLSFDILLGVREALTNAIRHGSNQDPSKEITFSINLVQRHIVIAVTDQGPGFDWQKVMQSCSMNLEESGRGICILGQYFDELKFNSKGNSLELKKRVS